VRAILQLFNERDTRQHLTMKQSLSPIKYLTAFLSVNPFSLNYTCLLKAFLSGKLTLHQATGGFPSQVVPTFTLKRRWFASSSFGEDYSELISKPTNFQPKSDKILQILWRMKWKTPTPSPSTEQKNYLILSDTSSLIISKYSTKNSSFMHNKVI